MRARELIDGRFNIERHAGSGGMGYVFQARDRESGEPVALKLLSAGGAAELNRFAREAKALAAIRLHGVVQYVAHGATADGQPYLAMEWLTGETSTRCSAAHAVSPAVEPPLSPAGEAVEPRGGSVAHRALDLTDATDQQIERHPAKLVRGFLENAPEQARTLALAAQWQLA